MIIIIISIWVVDFKCIPLHSVVEIMLPWSKFDDLLISGTCLYFSDSNEYVNKILNKDVVLSGLRNDVGAIVVRASAVKLSRAERKMVDYW